MQVRILKEGEVFFSYEEYKEVMRRRTPEYCQWLTEEIKKQPMEEVTI